MPHDMQVPWHALPANAALAALGSAPAGLDAAEAAARLARHGPNALPEPPRPGLFARFLRQFDDLLIRVLLVAAGLTAFLGEWADTAVILAVVVINAGVGLMQEGRAERALEAIGGLLAPRAAVLRDGVRRTLPAEHLVPGDIVLLEAGDRVPADLRLLEAAALRVEEAALTGESVPVEKSAAPVTAEAPLAERAGMAFTGTLVVAGQARGVVVATGAATEIGRVGSMLAGLEAAETPLLRQMKRLARVLTVLVLGLSAVVFAIAVMRHGMPFAGAVLVVVSLAVSAIPEGLPAVLSVTLALGVRRMAARNAIIRRLPAVETLGAVSVICTDKTGTLTTNEMAVRSAAWPGGEATVGGEGYAPMGWLAVRGAPPPARLAEVAVLCNDAALREGPRGWAVEGDPMEGALLAFAARAGADADALEAEHPRRAVLPFDAAHRLMATLHPAGGGVLLAVKGAPEAVLPRCVAQADGGPFDAAAWTACAEAMAARGQRVLALAMREDAAAPAAVLHLPEGLTLLGLLGLADPPRPEARTAVAECRAAGIRVVMITGDHAATGAAIAAELGIAEAPRALTGAELDALDEAAFTEAVTRTDVFARVSPGQKLRLVEALQRDGTVVAMTGDGVNDAPALKRADIGIAMGQRGTEAAKQAAQMVLADDNFASIAAAVREGRTVYDNLRKVIVWNLPTDGGEALVIAFAVVFGLALPMTPLQVLWINTITATALGMALAFEPTEPGTMREAPRDPRRPMLSGFLLWRFLLVSVLIALAAFGIFDWVLARGVGEDVARTAVVNAIVALEIAYLFAVRRGRGALITSARPTAALSLGIAVTAAGQVLLTYAPPLQAVFGTAALGVAEWAGVATAAAVFLVVLEAEKALRRPRVDRRPGSVLRG
ncbi:HAD-IC family P-type ATPase [Roseomonas eburnea]|uniref:HAD-IC family P-type ATPase n=1 Tax=Neoroseomonas eburnea TaxID=1346889 RepID=A0A9X9X8G5_9PROT|nr:HAD-IC family P-type ATPase [Neoroseomonas eburnea]MBR0680001.1 HAD-IC family P-type ATPase [Neoroseomonas eburnea]